MDFRVFSGDGIEIGFIDGMGMSDGNARGEDWGIPAAG